MCSVYANLTRLQFALDRFETPNLTQAKRNRQLLGNLRAIVERLRDWGTLLIVDVQKTDELAPKPTLTGVTEEGYKITGMPSFESNLNIFSRPSPTIECSLPSARQTAHLQFSSPHLILFLEQDTTAT